MDATRSIKQLTQLFFHTLTLKKFFHLLKIITMNHFTLKNFSRLMASTLLFFCLSTTSIFAHWNSKGPFGGGVKCMIAADTNLYIGTYAGGVFRSVNKTLKDFL